MVSSFLIDIIVLLLAAVVLVPIAQALKLGSVTGFLIAGVIAGPPGLGVIGNIDEISHLAEMGVILLLFIIGVELRPTRLWLMRRLVFGLGTLQVVITGVILSCVCYLFFGVTLNEAILIGPALALSSTAFVLQILLERRSLTSVYGRASIAILLLQDLAVIPLITLVPLLAAPEWNVGVDIGVAIVEAALIVGLVIFVGRYMLQPVMHRIALSGNPDIFTAFSILLVVGTALLTEHFGLSMGLGAFLAGLLISDSSYRHQMKAEIQPFRGLLLGLFFMSMGMSIDLGLLYQNPLFMLGSVLLLLFIKIVVLIPIAHLFGIRDKHQIAVSLLLSQSGEFALVLFSLAHEVNVLSYDVYNHLLLIILLSMLATPLFASVAARISSRSARPPKASEIPSPETAPIVIAGFGRVGRRIGEILSLTGKPYVAIEMDPAVVEEQSQKGFPIYYGDVHNPGVLQSLGIEHAELIIVTVNDPKIGVELVAAIRDNDEEVTIYARGHGLAQCIKLKQAGANHVVSENIEASLELAHLALVDVGVEEKKRDAIIHDFRHKYRLQIDDAVNAQEHR